MRKFPVSEILLSIFLSSAWTRASQLFKPHSGNDEDQACNGNLHNKTLVDENYESKHWPERLKVEECISSLRSGKDTVMQLPHPCALPVYVSLVFVDLNLIDLEHHFITLKVIYSEHWKDSRIILPSSLNPSCHSNYTKRMVYLEPKHLYRSQLWTPDFYMKGVRQARTLRFGEKTEALILHSDNIVSNTVTLNLILMCDMHFEDYPFDTQICNITIESFGIYYDRIGIVWDTLGARVHPQFLSVGYDILVTTHKPSAVVYAGHIFPQLKATLTLRRLPWTFLLLIYVPSMLHFLIAWLAIFLPKEVSQGRCIVCCSTTLSLISMLSVHSHNSPHGGYVKSLDVWSYFSLFFQCLCLMDAMIDTRLLYAASNMKRNPTEVGSPRVWRIITSRDNWLGKEVQLVHTQDEGACFTETLHDIGRLTSASTVTIAEGHKATEAAIRRKNKNRFSPHYYLILRLIIMYQEWSQYVLLVWYGIFVSTYWIVYVPMRKT